MSFQDKSLECSDCGTTFTFSTEEQEEFQSRGYTNEPKRCPECRQARKSERLGNGGNSYGNGNNGYTPGRQMFPAVCSDCGKSTSVPFEPRQGRPVYCSDCYRKVRAGR
ncbi:MAG TPA: CxxC-x17-CxxC domain-containing protein [Dehalococcoidales bacterium]|nr:CxxC-x17-CxxC domain-containing protein [Dehalococcoidales bacterium]